MATPEIGRLLTAMITPFKADGSVDYQATEKLAAMLVADGSDGVVVSGTTGESPTLSDDEKIELIKVIKKAIPRHSVVAGTGSSDTHHSVELSERAMKASRSPVAMLICSCLRPSLAAISARFSRSAVICACIARRITSGGVRFFTS